MNGMLTSQHADVLIVGAGAAGCILARRFADRAPDARIVLLEAGGDGRSTPFTASDLGSVLQTWAPASNWQLNTVPQVGLSGRTVSLTQGKVLGGGTSVNAMMYVRGDLSVVDEWYRKSGRDPAWSPERYLAVFRDLESCSDSGFDPVIRGTRGPIQVRTVPRPSISSLAFLEACAEIGCEVRDFNVGLQANAAGLMQLNLERDDTRCSTARAFLSDPLPPNLILHCHAEVKDLILNSDRVTAVRLSDGTLMSADQVVVAAGAFQTPSLLMASGIGDPERLAVASITCEVENLQVGRNLSDHMRALVAYASTADPGRTDFLCEAALFQRSGIFDSPEPDMQINFSAGIEGFIAPEFLPTPAPPHTVIFVPVLARPRSRGSVFPLGPTVEHGFGIDPGYLSDPQDLKVYARAVELVRELAAAPAMVPYCSTELCPGAMDPEAYLRGQAQTIWHPVGSCAIGQDPADSACTPDFRLRGISNLFVVDASVLPSLPSGNPQASIFAMASIASESIASQLGWE